MRPGWNRLTTRRRGPTLVLAALWLLTVSLYGVGLPTSSLLASADPFDAFARVSLCGQPDMPDPAPAHEATACQACCLLPLADVPPLAVGPTGRWLLPTEAPSTRVIDDPRHVAREAHPPRGPPDLT